MSKKEVSGAKSAFEYAVRAGMPRYLNFQTPSEAPPAAPVPASTTPPAQQYVSAEDFKKYQESLDSRIQSISGQIGVVVNATKVSKKSDSQPPENPTLTEQVKVLQDRDKAQREREKLTVITDALKNGGVPAAKATREARLILMDHGDKIQVDDKFNVVYRESEDKSTDASGWIGAYLKTDEGKMLVPPKATIDAGGGGKGSGEGAGGVHPFSKMTYKEIMDSPRTDLAKSFRHQHPQEWEEKKRAFQDTGK